MNPRAWSAVAAPHFDLRRPSAGSSRPVHFALFAPLHYEVNYAYPLLIWLHGPQANETQLNEVMPHISLRNYVAVAPRGTVEQGRSCSWQDTPAQWALSEQRVLQCLELAQQKYHVAPQRVFIAGLENAGTLAIRLALRHPELFAGVISVDGGFPQAAQPLAAYHTARQVPLLMLTNQASELYTESAVCQDLRLWHAANMRVTVRQYPNDRGVTDLMFGDLNNWMMEQISNCTRTVVSNSLTTA